MRAALLIGFCLTNPFCPAVRVAGHDALGVYESRDGRVIELRDHTFCVLKTGGHEALCRWQEAAVLMDGCEAANSGRYFEFVGLLPEANERLPAHFERENGRLVIQFDSARTRFVKRQ